MTWKPSAILAVMALPELSATRRTTSRPDSRGRDIALAVVNAVFASGTCGPAYGSRTRLQVFALEGSRAPGDSFIRPIVSYRYSLGNRVVPVLVTLCL